MNCRLTDLRHKEVISVCDGTRIGCVDDVLVDTKSARIASLIIFGRSGLFGLFGKCEDYIIPWEKIELIGEDTIIISCKTPNPVKGLKSVVLAEKIKIFDILLISQNYHKINLKYMQIAQLYFS